MLKVCHSSLDVFRTLPQIVFQDKVPVDLREFAEQLVESQSEVGVNVIEIIQD